MLVKPTSPLKKISIVLLCIGLISSTASNPVSAASRDDEKAAIYDTVYYDPNMVASAICTTSASGGAAGAKVPTNFNLGKTKVERQINLIKALMSDYGLTPAQAAGPVGNFMHESGGTHLPPDVNEGGSAGPPAFKGGYGWAQWTGGRQDTFITFAVNNGYMKNRSVNATDAANYAYLKKELAEGYTDTITQLKKQRSPEDAAVSFEATFERAGVPALTDRKKNARDALSAYISSSGVSGSGASTGCNIGGVAIVGDVAFPLQGKKNTVKNPEIFKNGDTDLAGHPYTAYDINANTGTPVVAFMGGKVISVSTDKCPGRLIGIYNKESDLVISYMHLSFNEKVAEGDTVKAGDLIGYVGTTQQGCVVPHLHIDAIKGSVRPACSRESCSDDVKAKFVSIGKQLFFTYQKLANY